MWRIIGEQDPQSWAQSIQAYQRGKSQLPWNPADVPPPTYIKHFDVLRKSREMDPVLMRHRNPDVEAKRKRREEERVRTALNKAKSRQMRVEQNYDIVTHTPNLSAKKEPPLRPSRPPDTRTSYDILSHVPRERTHDAPLIYADGEGPEVVPQRAVAVEGETKPKSHQRRDVDVVSNRFLEKHEERMVEEQRFLRQTAEEKYRRTHDYNIIAGAYYDQEKERNFVKSREDLGAMQGRAQQCRLPPSIRYGEGNSYNVINQQPKKNVVQETSTSAADRGLFKRTRGRHAHEENIRQHERAAAISEQRTLNRPSHMRHIEVLRTGHNVISNQVFTGREGKPPPQPRAKPPPPVWNRLSGQPGRPETDAVESSPVLENQAAEPNTGDATGSAGTNSRDLGGDRSGSGGRGYTGDGRGTLRSSRDECGNGQPNSHRLPSPLREGKCVIEGGSGDDGGEEKCGSGGKSEAAVAATTKPAVPLLDLSRQPND